MAALPISAFAKGKKTPKMHIDVLEPESQLR